MRASAIRKRLRRLERSMPELEGEPLPYSVVAYALRNGHAFTWRTGARGTIGFPHERPTVVDKAIVFMIQERLAAIERGDTGPWIQLVEGEYEETRLSTDPAAVAELDRILVAVGFDPSTAPKPWVDPSRRRRDPDSYF